MGVVQMSKEECKLWIGTAIISVLAITKFVLHVLGV